MKAKFETLFMEEVRQFLSSLDSKTREKLIYNIDKAATHADTKLFKKLKGEIWYFRTMYNKTHYRIFAFWDKTHPTKTLVVATHGIVKKSDKVPEQEIEKAEHFRQLYFKISK